jgi:hypothetical protein
MEIECFEWRILLRERGMGREGDEKRENGR